MKVKKYTVTLAELNSGNPTELSMSYTDSAGNIYYPTSLKFSNTTNSTNSFVYLANDDEKTEIANTPTNYEYLTIPSGESTTDVPKSKYIRIKKDSGTANADMTIWAINFSIWKR